MSEIKGRLVSGFGSFFNVDINGKVVEARARGRIKKEKIKLLIGDIVTLEKEQETYAITGVVDRKNSIIRPAVANVDMVLVVISTKNPDINYKQIDKLLAFLENEKLEIAVCINKCDIGNYNEIKEIYQKAGYIVITASAEKNENIESVRELLKDKITALAGCSGVGKSSLINAIDEAFSRETGTVGKIKRGRHTTTHASLLPLSFGGYVADTPGFSVVDLSSIKKEDLSFCFKEFNKYSDKCKFLGCTHKNAKGCKVIEEVNKGNISKSRYESYLELFDELSKINIYR